MHYIIKYGHKARTTHCTKANNVSSRSHAICQIRVKVSDEVEGKLILCDLAGSERAQDCQSNSKQRRLEGANINRSLLALKECIRAMHDKSSHVPFRASKLTLALRDSFLSGKNDSKIVMIACICPGSKSSDHTINTLRYADRLKMKQNRDIDPNKAVYLNDSVKPEPDDAKIKMIRSDPSLKKARDSKKKVPKKINPWTKNGKRSSTSNHRKYGKEPIRRSSDKIQKKESGLLQEKRISSKNIKKKGEKRNPRSLKNSPKLVPQAKKGFERKQAATNYQKALKNTYIKESPKKNINKDQKITKPKRQGKTTSNLKSRKQKQLNLRSIKRGHENSYKQNFSSNHISTGKKQTKKDENYSPESYKLRNRRLAYKKQMTSQNYKIENLDMEEFKRSQQRISQKMKKQKDLSFLKNSIKLEKGIFLNKMSLKEKQGFDEKDEPNEGEDSDDAMFNHQQKIDDLVDMHEEILNLHSRVIHVIIIELNSF